MKTSFFSILIFILTITVWSCNSGTKSKVEIEKRTTIDLETDYGTMIIELYNETPLHRDNFIKLISEGVYDSLLFHRVINEFMIQGGDPDSKNASKGDTLGNGGFPYLIDAEFNPSLFHKKGALAAARTNNPERASSSTQFYFVQGKTYNDSLLTIADERINDWLAQHFSSNEPANKALSDSLQKAIEQDDYNRYYLYSDSLRSLAKAYTNFEKYTIPEEHREVYKTIGGTPHLDQNYTVFGEVISGIKIIDSIAAVQTNSLDRPIKDIRLRSIKVFESHEK